MSNMDIFYTIDDNFVPQLAANICSVGSNHSSNNDIVFHVLSKGISEKNQVALTKLVSNQDQEIYFYDINGFMDRIGFEFDTVGWNEIVLARLLMAEFLPKDVHRVIYLDGDTLVLDDIAELWNQDLGGKTLGMVCEPTANMTRRQSLGIGEYFYHNAGVLLVDLDRWRVFGFQQKILNYCRDKTELLFANDQDALNVVLKDEIKTLAPRFDYSNIFDYYTYSFLNRLMPGFATADEYRSAKQHPVVVHFLGEERPWREGNSHRFRYEYRTYLNKTEWRNTSNEKGWKAYFIAWRIFNWVTKPLPCLRYGIINSLIPSFMKWRARNRRSA